MTEDREYTLSDLIQERTIIDVKHGKLEVYPIGLGDIAHLLAMFPALLEFMDGKSDSKKIARIAAIAPKAIPTVIATACGDNSPSSVAMARRLNASDQLKLINAIFETTFSGGVSDFFDEVAAMMGQAAGEMDAKTEEWVNAAP
jgi:hypothetical protein